MALPDHILSEIVKAAILIDDRHYYRRELKPVERDVAYLQQLYFDVDAESRFDAVDDVEAFMFRLSALQFPAQGAPWKGIPRSIVLHTGYRPDTGPDFDVASRFRDILGMGLEEYTFLGASVAALALLSPSGVIDVGFLSRLAHPHYSQTNLDIFFGNIAINYEGFRQECTTRCDPAPGLEIYDYNPLVSHPIVQLPNGDFVCPVPRLLIERVTSGVYYDLAHAYDNEFLTYLGHAFQHYIGLLFAGIVGLDVRPEKEYGTRKAPRLSPDWLLVKDQTAVLECKTKRLRLGSRLPQFREQLKMCEPGYRQPLLNYPEVSAIFRRGKFSRILRAQSSCPSSHCWTMPICSTAALLEGL